ncbi:MAG TPA: hypothetical protein VLE97_06370 [Gaiellaceae bacterium]|nr:hypothetical protein [Gaiellaceae bacterium]
MSAFNGVKVFCATMFHQRQDLGEVVTHWIDDARRTRPSFTLVDIKVMQSSDDAFHCISICVFYNEDISAPKATKRLPRKGDPT